MLDFAQEQAEYAHATAYVLDMNHAATYDDEQVDHVSSKEIFDGTIKTTTRMGDGIVTYELDSGIWIINVRTRSGKIVSVVG